MMKTTLCESVTNAFQRVLRMYNCNVESKDDQGRRCNRFYAPVAAYFQSSIFLELFNGCIVPKG